MRCGLLLGRQRSHATVYLCFVEDLGQKGALVVVVTWLACCHHTAGKCANIVGGAGQPVHSTTAGMHADRTVVDLHSRTGGVGPFAGVHCAGTVATVALFGLAGVCTYCLKVLPVHRRMSTVVVLLRHFLLCAVQFTLSSGVLSVVLSRHQQHCMLLLVRLCASSKAACCTGNWGTLPSDCTPISAAADC